MLWVNYTHVIQVLFGVFSGMSSWWGFTSAKVRKISSQADPSPGRDHNRHDGSL